MRRALAAAALAALAYAAGAVFELGWLRLLAKPLPALCLAFWVGTGSRHRTLVALGLVLSAIGDLVLEAGAFLGGVGVFAAAHVAFIGGFLAVSARPRVALLAPYAAWWLGSCALLWPGLGAMAVPVLVYSALLTAMMWRAAACVGAVPRRLDAAIGAILFGLSDMLLAFDRFRAPLPLAGLWILLLYWAGLLGIARSAAPARG